MSNLSIILPDQSPIQEVAPGSFVYEYRDALTPEQCSSIIETFEKHEDDQVTGKVARGTYWPELKLSTDAYLRGQDHWEEADQWLHNALVEGVLALREQFTIFKEDELHDIGYQVQRTEPGQYYHWHKDLNKHSRSRVLVAIFYLNDVAKGAGGETEFFKQELKVRPEAGKLILFPPFWTHVHRGVTLLSGVKYIATTWVCYVGAKDDDGMFDDGKDSG